MEFLSLVSRRVSRFVREYRYRNYYWRVGKQHCSDIICRFSVRWTTISWDRTCVPESARGIKVHLDMDSNLLNCHFDMASLTSDLRVESVVAGVLTPEMVYGNIRKITAGKCRFDSIHIGAECALEKLVLYGMTFMGTIHVADGNRALAKIVIGAPLRPDWLQCGGRNVLRSVITNAY